MACTGSVAAEKSDILNLTLEELLQVRVSIASRNEESPVSAPSSVTVFTRRDIDALGLQTLEQLVNFVPGMRSYPMVSNSAQGYTFAARGLTVPSSNGILFLLDGHRLNVEQTGGPIFSRFISLASIARVEIIRGPGSALYGSNAFQGVINLISDSGVDQLSVEAGSAQGRHASLRYHGATTEAGFALTLESYRDKGYRYDDAFNPAHPTQTTTTYDPLEGQDLVLSSHWRDWNLFWRESNRHTEDFYFLGGLMPDGGFVDTGDRLLSINDTALTFGEDWHGSVRLDFHEGTTQNIAQLAPAGVFGKAPWLDGTSVDFKRYETGSDWVYKLNTTQRFNFGVEMAYVPDPYAYVRSNYTNSFPPHYVGSVRTIEDDSGRFLAPIARRTSGTYIQYQQEFTSAWQASFGLRHDRYSDVGSATTPRAAVIYTSPWQDTLRLSYGRAYRAPTYSEMYFQNNPVLVGNPDLASPIIRTVELGYGHAGMLLNYSATLFDSHVDEFIARHRISTGQVQTQNVGRVQTQGVELEGQVQIADGWRSRLSYTQIFHNDQQFQSDALADKVSSLTPKFWGSLALIYESPSWQASVFNTYTSRTPLLEEQAPYWIWGAQCRYHSDAGWAANLRVNNAADEHYDTISDDVGLGRNASGKAVRAVPNRGQFVWLGVDWRY